MRPILLFALLLPGCVTDGQERAERPPLPATNCGGGMFPDRFYYVDFGTEIFRQGTTLQLTPRADNAPGGSRELPIACTSDWKVTGPAHLTADRRWLVIPSDAPPGARVTLSFRVGSEEVAASFELVARDAQVLTGRRTQKSVANCSGADRVGELEFSPGNRFAITFQPFETYKDYWGTYTWDQATGRLVMTVDGGNFRPAGLDLDGTARLGADGSLVLEGFYLGARNSPPPPPPGCRYTF